MSEIAAGNIYDLGYQRLTGVRLGRRHAIWALYRESLRGAMSGTDIVTTISARSVPCTELNAYFTRAITEFVLPALQPRLLTFWHTEPDGAQHQRGAGHPDALQGIRDADRNLGAILDTFERLDIEGEPDVVVTSDHGFSTIGDRVDVGAALMEAGVKQSPDSTDVVVAEGMIYVPGGDAATVRRIVELLQRLEAAGPVITRTLGAPPAELVRFWNQGGRTSGSLRVLQNVGASQLALYDGPFDHDVVLALSMSPATPRRSQAATSWQRRCSGLPGCRDGRCQPSFRTEGTSVEAVC